MTGTANRMEAGPRSRAEACRELYSSFERSTASNARSTAAPPLSRAQTMPSTVPLAEMDGVGPGKGNTCSVLELGVVENNPFVSLKALRLSFRLPKYRVLFQ